MENNTLDESWQDFIRLEISYQISSFGRVRKVTKTANSLIDKLSLQTKIKPLAIQNSMGYAFIGGSVNNEKFACHVHRLVAKAFLDKDTYRKNVNHKNGVRDDNRVENLEWCTQKENIHHSIKMGLTKPVPKGDKSPRWGKTGKQSNNPAGICNPKRGAEHYLSKLVLNQENGVYYDSITEAARASGYHLPHLSKMLRGKRKNKSPFILA